MVIVIVMLVFYFGFVFSYVVGLNFVFDVDYGNLIIYYVGYSIDIDKLRNIMILE